MSAGMPVHSVPTQSLWQRFVAVDVTNTFCVAFSPHLSTVCNPHQFSETLSALMREWREDKWKEISAPCSCMGTRRVVAPARGGMKRRSLTGGGAVGKDLADDCPVGATVESTQKQNAVTAYYESVRVQRLMDEILFLSPEVKDASEVELMRLREYEAVMVQRQKWRRRCCLIRAIDEVWRACFNESPDFLLPVTEFEAPLYYRRIRRPVSVSSLYCGVWDATVPDYTELKSLLSLMRSNCETYNGHDSELTAQCRKAVRIGLQAARDAEAWEKRGVEGDRLLMTNLSTHCIGGNFSLTKTRMVHGVVDAEDEIPFQVLLADELDRIFPPRSQMAVSNGTQQKGGKDEVNSACIRDDGSLNHRVNSGGRRLVLRRAAPTNLSEGGMGATEPQNAVRGGGAMHTRLRLPLSSSSTGIKSHFSSACGEKGSNGDKKADEDSTWEGNGSLSRRSTAIRAVSNITSYLEEQSVPKGPKSVKERRTSRQRGKNNSGRTRRKKTPQQNDEEQLPKVRHRKGDRSDRETRVRRSGALRGREDGNGSKRSRKKSENHAPKVRRRLPSTSSSSTASVSSSFTSSSDFSEVSVARPPRPPVTAEKLSELEALMNRLDQMPMQLENIAELLSSLKRLKGELK